MKNKSAKNHQPVGVINILRIFSEEVEMSTRRCNSYFKDGLVDIILY